MAWAPEPLPGWWQVRAGLSRWWPCLRLREGKPSGQQDPGELGFGQSQGRYLQIMNGWGMAARAQLLGRRDRRSRPEYSSGTPATG